MHTSQCVAIWTSNHPCCTHFPCTVFLQLWHQLGAGGKQWDGEIGRKYRELTRLGPKVRSYAQNADRSKALMRSQRPRPLHLCLQCSIKDGRHFRPDSSLFITFISLMMAGGPEFGNQVGNVSSCVGSYMYSAVVFSDVSVHEKLSGETFANVDRARWIKLYLL